MAVAQGNCPSCGAPIEFAAGSSIAKVCEYCRATVFRSDRGLEDLGKVAAIANTPQLIAVGDQGKLGGRPFEVLGRVQLDHGRGPWDEYYVALDYGQSWGWLAYAQGMWFFTAQSPEQVPVPAHGSLQPEMDVPLGSAGSFRVGEVKTGRIVSAEGELPGAFPPGFVRHYVDLFGAQRAFATLDYGDNTGGYSVFIGRWFEERELEVTQIGPRTQQKVKLSQIRCPSCGGDVPKLSGERAERIGCPYCGAVSDITSQQVIAQQERAMATPDIPIGSRGTLDGIDYVCIAYVRRGSDFDGDHFSWDEYLLFSEGLGFRWLVKDETTWMWVMPVNLAEIDLRGLPHHVGWRDKSFRLRNENRATVEHVLGELFWKCEIGETTRASDYIRDGEVLSREAGPGEVRWSYSAPVPWPLIAQAFSLPEDGPGGRFAPPDYGGGGVYVGSGGGCGSNSTQLFVLLILLFVCVSAFNGCGFIPIPLPVFGGSGYYYGGK